jgi:N-acetylmuramoyl-L-alanine amidase
MTTEMVGISEEDQRQTSCIALAVYHEALNQGDKGQRAVVHVILNRVNSNRFATTPCGVVFQKGQFSFVHYGMGRLVPRASTTWNSIVRLVTNVRSGGSVDPTSGAMFFYNPKLARPAFRGSRTRIGAHIFVRG